MDEKSELIRIAKALEEARHILGELRDIGNQFLDAWRQSQPEAATKFEVKLTQGANSMAGQKAAAVNGLDIVINPNGTATASIVFEDANGNVTTNVPAAAAMPTWAASDAVPGPSVLQLTPSADGKTCAIKCVLPTPPPSPLPTGLTVAATIASGLDQQTAPETQTTQGIDVQAAPPGAASQFVLALTEP